VSHPGRAKGQRNTTNHNEQSSNARKIRIDRLQEIFRNEAQEINGKKRLFFNEDIFARINEGFDDPVKQDTILGYIKGARADKLLESTFDYKCAGGEIYMFER
jgi:hypothetical protein